MEEIFVSIVIYLHNNESMISSYLNQLYEVVSRRFKNYEVIFVDDASSDNTSANLDWDGRSASTLVKLNVHHGVELAMNAGVNLAVGDYVYEIDTVEAKYPFDILEKSYNLALEGHDIVNICPTKMSGASRLFYKVFNRYSNSVYEIKTEVGRIVSRRAINRVQATNETQLYRKAAYAACGLKQTDIYFEGDGSVVQEGRFDLCINSLILYTDMGFKVSTGITVFMIIVSLMELIYTIVVYLTGKPIEGWTTTMLVISFGFTGLFTLETIIIKFLSLVLDLNFNRQRYKVESVEKLMNRKENSI